MDPISAYKSLNTDPEFAKLSYEDQISVRQRLAQSVAASDPEFQLLGSAEQEAAMKRMVVAPPVTLNPEFQKQIRNLMQQAEAGNTSAQEEYDMLYAELDTSLHGGLINSIGQKVNSAIGKALNDQFIQRNPSLAVANTEDAAKVFQYLNAREQVGMPSFRKSSSDVASTIQKFAGGAMDFAALTPMFQGIAAGTSSIPIVQSLANGGRGAQLVGKVLAPLTTESIAAGLAGIGTMKLGSMMTSNPDADPMKDVQSFALNFGFGAAMNFAISGAMRTIVPHAISAIKSVFGRKDLSALGAAAQMDEAQLAAAIDEAGTSHTVNKVLKAPLSDYQNAQIAMRDEVARIGKLNPTTLNDSEKLIYSVFQSSHDMTIRPMANGGFEMYYTKPVAGEHLTANLEKFTAKNILEATDEAAKHLAAIAKREPTSGAIQNPAVEQYGAWLVRWNETAQAATRVAEASQKTAGAAGRTGLQNRPIISTDELAAITPGSGIQAIKLRAGFEPEMVQRLANQKQMLVYDDLQRFSPDAANPNAVMLSSKMLTVSESVTQRDGLGNIIQARAQGYDALRLVDDSGNTTGFVPLVPNNLKVLVPEVSEKGMLMSTSRGGMAQRPLTEGSMIGEIRGDIKKNISAAEAGENEGLLIQQVMDMTADRIDPAAVRAYSKMLTGNSAVNTDVRFTTEKVPSVKYENGILKIEVPEAKLVGQDRVTFARELTKQLQMSEAMKGLPTGPQRVQRGLMQLRGKTPDAIERLFVADKTHGIWSTNFLRDVLKSELNADLKAVSPGVYSAQIAGTEVTGSLTDIWTAAKPFVASPKAVKDELLQVGVKLVQRNGKLVAKTSSNQEFEFNTMMEAAEHFGVDTGKLPSAYRPSFVEIDPTSNNVQLYAESATIKLGKQQAFELLNSFERNEPINRVTISKAGDGFASYLDTENVVKFVDAKSKTSMVFKNLAAAREWVSENYGTFKGTRDMALSKGANVEFYGNQYHVTMNDAAGREFVVGSLKEVDNVLAKLPTNSFDATEMVPGAQQILDMLPEDLLAKWKSFSRNFQPVMHDALNDYAAWKPAHTASSAQHMSNVLSTFSSSIEKLRVNGKLHPAMVPEIEKMKAAFSAQRVDKLQADRLLDRLFNVSTKNKISAEADEVIYRYMGAQRMEEMTNMRALKPEELKLVNQLRTVLNNAATKFGLNKEMLNGNYMTRFRSAISRDSQLRAVIENATTSSEVLTALDRSPYSLREPVKEARLWFENSRKSELLDAVFDTSAYSSVRRYLHAGIKKYWLDVPLQEFTGVYNAVKFEKLPGGQLVESGKLTSDADVLLTRFRDMVTGGDAMALSSVIARDVGVDATRKFGSAMAAILDKAGQKDLATKFRSDKFVQNGEGLLNDVMTIGYASMLGGRPMAAIRNVMQIYSIYGPAFGFESLDNAVSHWTKLSASAKEGFLRNLERMDVVSAMHPFADDIAGPQVIQKGSQFLLKWFSNSDEYTRVIGYSAATSKFISAVQKLGSGKLGDIAGAKDTFLAQTGLDLFRKTEPEMVEGIWKTVTENIAGHKTMSLERMSIGDENLKLASDMFAKKAVDLTLFNYNTWNKPMAFSGGAMGRMLGQLGSFTASYRNYFYHLARNVSPLQFAGHMTSFVASNLAVWGAFQAAGIRANDFIPFAGAVPSVGPIADSLITMQSAMDDPTARGQLMKMFSPVVQGKKPSLPGVNQAYIQKPWVANYPTILPGSILFNYAAKAYDFASRGDYWKALISLSGAHADPEGQSDVLLDVAGLKATVPGLHPQALARNLAGLLSRTQQ